MKPIYKIENNQLAIPVFFIRFSLLIGDSFTLKVNSTNNSDIKISKPIFFHNFFQMYIKVFTYTRTHKNCSTTLPASFYSAV